MPDWPHAPVHRLSETGAYMVTAGTYRKAHHLWDAQRLDLVLNALLAGADEFNWRLQAWAVMSNTTTSWRPRRANRNHSAISSESFTLRRPGASTSLTPRRDAACGISSTTVTSRTNVHTSRD